MSRFNVLLACSAAFLSRAASGYCILPSTVDVQIDSLCDDFEAASSNVTLFVPKNSKHSFQVLIEATPQSHTNNLEFKDTDSLSFSYLQVGYVNVSNTTRYDQQRVGWLPDPLIPATNMGGTSTSATYCEGGSTCTFFVEVEVSSEATAGTVEGEIDLLYNDGNALIPYSIHIWDFAIPSLKDGAFASLFVASTSDAMHTQSADQDLNNIYNESGYTDELKSMYYDILSEARIPPDDLYLSTPRPIEDYQYLSEVGQQLFGILDVSNLEGGDGCSDFDEQYIQSMLKTISPIAEKLNDAGILSNAYVYGFDEQPSKCEAGIRNLFGAVKAKWPEIKTVAVLNWSGEEDVAMPTDEGFPLDIWTIQYQYFNEDDAKAWTESKEGRKVFGYHCIEPSDSNYLNSFIEKDLIETRLLFWYMAARTSMTGWLYYAVDLWDTGCNVNPDAHTFMSRENILTAKTNFNPGNCIWEEEYGDNFFANGDGQFIYPGADGPIPTTRLVNIRDGLQDAEMFRMLEEDDMKSLIERVVRNATDFTSDAVLFDQVRKEAGDMVEARVRG